MVQVAVVVVVAMKPLPQKLPQRLLLLPQRLPKLLPLLPLRKQPQRRPLKKLPEARSRATRKLACSKRT